MAKFFRGTEKQSFTYPSIVERKSGPNYAIWITGVVIIVVVSFIIYLLFNLGFASP